MAAYDFLIVGSGPFGATVARCLTDSGKKCLVIEKRGHLAGNCFSEKVEGIEVHRHGPHFFRTNDADIWQFVQRFAKFVPYVYKGKINYKGRLFSFPMNLETFRELYGTTTSSQAHQKLASMRLQVDDSNAEGWVLNKLGREIYEMFYEGYTRKQWGREPSALPSSIVSRLPIRMTSSDAYFDDKFQGLPEEGFTALFSSMLDGIEVRLNCDFFQQMAFWKSQAATVVYSGPLDQLFAFDLGRLHYRSLSFELEVRDGTFQSSPVVNYPDINVPWTRIAEYKLLPPTPTVDHTVIVKEFPEEYNGTNEPYYPINDTRNSRLVLSYLDRAKKAGIVVGGRMGSYRYLSMHQVIAQGRQVAERLLNKAAVSKD